MSKDLVSLVDENDTVIGLKARDDLTPADNIRVNVLWIENSCGEVLLQQRALTKKIGPGEWGPAVAGTVESHETYFQNVVKEAQEELGLSDITPIEVGKRLFMSLDAPFGRIFTFYKTIIDRPVEQFIIPKQEVAQLKWVAKQPLLQKVATDPKSFVPSSVFWKDIYY